MECYAGASGRKADREAPELMSSPLTRVLIRIFALGFYRAHAALLLFFFVTLIVYGLFINVLNQTHLPPDEVVMHNLKVVLTIISSPAIATVVLILWLFLTAKSWNYVLSQLQNTSNRFLWYIGTAFPVWRQFRSWFVVQCMILLPVAGYGLFSLAAGVVFGHYIIPVAMLLYVLLLASVSAWVYVRYSNRPVRDQGRPFLTRIVKNWSKPFFSLFLYHAFNKLKVALVITKLLSAGIMLGGIYLLADVNDALRTTAIVILGVVTAHVVLIYYFCRFENLYLSFSWNFPYGRMRMYFNYALIYLSLMLPESIWLLAKPDLKILVVLWPLGIGTAILFHSLLYTIALDMKRFIYWVFGLFNLFFFMILLDLLWILIPGSLLASVVLFYRSYYRKESVHPQSYSEMTCNHRSQEVP